MRAVSDVPILGEVSPGFEPVRDAFRENFLLSEDQCDIGAAVSVYRHGELVVDLAGGHRDLDQRSVWTHDTLANVWSSTKGITAVAFARLVGRNLVSYEDRVVDYWPEFGAAGKETTTIAELLSHQAGLNGFREHTSIEDFGNWELVTSRLAAQAPFWYPGSDTSYHAMTYGFLVGELARRITGLEPRALFEREIADPLQADIQIGLKSSDHTRVANLIPFEMAGTPAAPDPLAAHAMVNPVVRQDWANRDDWRQAQVPAANGHATARGLAKVYGVLANAGQFNDTSYLDAQIIDALRKPRSTRSDRFLGNRIWAAGVSLNNDGAWGPDPETFGHGGWGGSFGCANMASGIGIGYVMNRMGGQIALDPRAVRLCNAIFWCAAQT